MPIVEFKLPPPHVLLLVQFAATAMMTGIIWFVQVVHYPLFGKIPQEGFVAYELAHTVRTGFVVGPLMLVELITAVTLIVMTDPLAGDRLYLAAFGCLLLIWASTFLLQVPLHAILEHRHDPGAITRLVSTNWIRTILWTIRLALLSTVVLRRVFS
jgi:hypothetical protein